MQRSVWIFRHIECEGPGFLGRLLDRYKLPYQIIAIDEQSPVPADINGARALIFMGGPMSVNDNDSWIEQEMHLIRQAHRQNLPVLGHCLGAQLISKALGAAVYPNKCKEIGWLPVQRIDSAGNPKWLQSLPPVLEAFHWHGETFELPTGATPILQSEHCTNQGFILNRILALQCHMEVTADMIEQWIDRYPHDISKPSATVQNREQMLKQAERRCRRMHEATETFYVNWLTETGLI